MSANLYIPDQSHLNDYVTAIWEVSGATNIQETILPKGIVEMIFNLGEPMNGILPNRIIPIATPLCFIQGVNTGAINVDYHGQQHLFGVRLQPHMVKNFLGILPSELNNAIVDLTLIKPEFKVLWHQLAEASSFVERKNIIEKDFPVITGINCIRTKKLSELFLSDNISQLHSVDSLSEQVYYSHRHLNRKTKSLFGISAEELITYKKFQHAVIQLHYSDASFTDIAYNSGFYDQSHFCRVFKNYSGITAKHYKLNKGPLPFHLFN